jgi:L-serine deaminase
MQPDRLTRDSRFDASTQSAMETETAQTAKDMNSKYKETSEAGLAVSVTLC